MENEEKVEEVETTEVQGEETTQQETKTYSEEELNQKLEEMRKQINEANQKAWDKRWGREKSKMEKEFAKERELAKVMQEQTQAKNMDDLLDLTYQNYGVERPVYSNPKDDEILGKYDAKEILTWDDVSIEQEANRLAGMNRTAREEATFIELGKYLTDKKAKEKRIQEIKESGIEESILENKDFQDFSSKFNDGTSMKDIYDMFSRLQPKKEKPFSPGSTNTTKVNETSEFFTLEEFKNLTAKDLENPVIYEKAMRSRVHFK